MIRIINFIMIILFVLGLGIILLLEYLKMNNGYTHVFVSMFTIFFFIFILYFIFITGQKLFSQIKSIKIKRITKFIVTYILCCGLSYGAHYVLRLTDQSLYNIPVISFGVAYGVAFYDLVFTHIKKKN